jgi:hypothetical protein
VVGRDGAKTGAVECVGPRGVNFQGLKTRGRLL